MAAFNIRVLRTATFLYCSLDLNQALFKFVNQVRLRLN